MQEKHFSHLQIINSSTFCSHLDLWVTPLGSAKSNYYETLKLGNDILFLPQFGLLPKIVKNLFYSHCCLSLNFI